jgi:hypothetical protein
MAPLCSRDRQDQRGAKHLPRKRQKQERMPETYNLHQIEARASMVGNEIHYDPRRMIVTRKIAEYVPCPQAGAQGQWWETYHDDLVEAALWASKINGVTASMFRTLQSLPNAHTCRPERGQTVMVGGEVARTRARTCVWEIRSQPSCAACLRGARLDFLMAPTSSRRESVHRGRADQREGTDTAPSNRRF